MNLTSEITDHYVEDNSAIQDNWAIRPEEIVLNGLIAELTDAPAPNNTNAIAPNALPLNSQMVPSLSPGGTSLAKQRSTGQYAQPPYSPPSLYDYYTGNASLATAGSPPAIVRQSRAFGYFYAMWKGRQLCTVETAWGIMTNMAILRLRAVQDRTTRHISEFTVTFKKIRTAGTVNVAAGKLAGRCAQQSAAPAQQGNVGQTEIADPGSFLAQMAQAFGIQPKP